MKKTVLLKTIICFFALTVMGVSHRARVSEARAYKLGKVYADCLEGYSGEVISSSVTSPSSCSCESDGDCRMRGQGMACINKVCKECRTDAQCRTMYADNRYKCSGYRCGLSECSSTSECTEMYGHLHSCVTEDGFGWCKITCNWGKIVAANKHVIKGTSLNVIDRLLRELQLTANNFANTTFAAWNALLVNNSYPNINNESLYTCTNGAIKQCVNNESVCIPLSIASGGTYGVGTDSSTLNAGNYHYYARYMSNMQGFPVESWAQSSCLTVVWPGNQIGRDNMFNSSLNQVQRMQETVGLLEYASYYSLANRGLQGVTLGLSRMCEFYKMNPMYQTHNSNYLRATDMRDLVLILPQNKSVNLYSSVTRGAKVNNRWIGAGDVWCCSYAAGAVTANDPYHCDSDKAANRRTCVSVIP